LAHCDDIVPLLGAFNDGELPHHQADEVSRHLDRCETCKQTLLDFLMLGHHLRGAAAMPSLEGFAEGVLKAIEDTRRPFRDRLRYRFADLRESWVAAVSLTGAALATTALVLVLAQPQTMNRVSRLLGRPEAPPPGTSVVTQNSPVVAQSLPVVARNSPGTSPQPASPEAPPSSNSETFISRLEAKPPSVAMWSEPDDKTTVIWLGDDASGNE
jgi:anti-sigma factor RsiW